MIRNLHLIRARLAHAVLFLAAATIVKAQPAYTGTTFDAVQEVMDDATLFFGVVVALAVLVTGFFLGRRWLARVG